MSYYDPKNDRPYHETIIVLLRGSFDLASFIVATACPSNHEDVIEAVRAAGRNGRFTGPEVRDIVSALEAKKVAVERRASSGGQGRRADTGVSIGAGLAFCGEEAFRRDDEENL